MKYILILLLSLFNFNSFATPAATKNVDGTFRLSQDSEKIMKIDFSKLKGSGPWEVPVSSLVKIKFTTGVYRRFEGDITYVIVKVLSKKEQMLLVTSEDLEAGDEIATAGTHYLRMAEADLNSDTVDSCSH